MADLQFEVPETEEIEVDDETLAAIDRGLADVQAGRTVSMDEVSTRLAAWLSNSDSPKPL